MTHDATPAKDSIVRGYRLRAYPTKEQATTFAQWMGCRRWVWSWGLETRERAYAEAGESLSSVDLGENVAGHYDEKPWLEAVPTAVLQQSLRDLDKAYLAWWKGHAARPTFAKRSDGQSARVTIDARHPTKRALWGIGVVIQPRAAQ